MIQSPPPTPSWTLSLGLYHLSLASMYFGKLHIVTLTQCFCWIAFVLLAGSKIGVKAKDDEGIGGGQFGGNSAGANSGFDFGVGMKKSSRYFGNVREDPNEKRGLMNEDDVMDIL